MNTLPTTLIAFFWHFIKKQWFVFTLIQLLCLGWALDHTLFPYIFMQVIDLITNMGADRSNMWTLLAPTLWMWAGLWLLVELCYRLSGVLFAYSIPKIEADVRMSMFNYVQHHSYRYFNDNMAGNLANKISDMPKGVTNIIQMMTGLFVPVFVAVLITLGFFLTINLLFALILLVWVIAHLCICLYFSKGCSEYANIHAEARSKLSGGIVDSFSNHITLRLFGRQAQEYRHLLDYQKSEQQKHKTSLIYNEKMKLALGLASFFWARRCNYRSYALFLAAKYHYNRRSCFYFQYHMEHYHDGLVCRP